jgi:P-type Ca2+ transporter type 2C
MDGPPAQSLGVEPVDPRIMNLPPRSKSASVLTKPLIRRVLTSATLIMLGTLAVYIHEMIDEPSSSSSYPDLSPSSTYTSSLDSIHHKSAPSKLVTRRDTTMTFTTFVLFDMFNALTCRSESKSVLFGELKLFGNKMFNYAVAGSLLGQLCVIYLPFLQKVFQTEGLWARDLAALVILGSTVFWVDEARKFWMKWKRRQGLGAGYSGSV